MNNFPKTFKKDFHDEERCAKMRYSQLDGTDMVISHFSIGGASFVTSGFQFYEQIRCQEEVNEIVSTLVKRGVNYIDTAPWYGQGSAEECLGIALQNIPRDTYYLASKVGCYEVDVAKHADYTRERTIRSVDESLRRLKVDYLDLIQIHEVDYCCNLDQIVRHTLPALAELKNSGKVRFIGITGYALGIMKKIVKLAEEGAINTVLSYGRFNLANQDLLDYLPFFQEKGLGVINASIANNGLFNGDKMPDWQPAADIMKKFCLRAAEHCKQMGYNLASLSNKWCLQQRHFATNLSSFSSLEQALENLDSATNPLTNEEANLIDELMTKFFNPMPMTHWENANPIKYWKEMEEAGAEQKTDL